MAASGIGNTVVDFPEWASWRVNEREILATIAESTDAFIQVADCDYRWLAINKASADEFERIFGVRPQVGMSMLDILADRPEHQAAVKALWSRALAGKEFTEIGEFGDAERRVYEMKYNRYLDADGNQIGAFQIVTDVTDRVRAQQELEKAEAALRQSQKMEAIGQLSGGLAHDFNNLLQIIAGNLDLVRRNLPPGQPKLQRWVVNAIRGSARATNLAHRLLAFAKPSPGLPSVVDANEVIADMSDLIRHAAGGGIAVTFNLLNEEAAVRVDPNQLESAILNLVVNARDAMPSGGQLVISTLNGSRSDLPPDSRGGRGRGSVIISVTDSGHGMDKDTLSHLFEPFFTTKQPGQGTGLGLAMVYSFVHLAGGQVHVTSKPDQGSTFKLAFPRAAAEEFQEKFLAASQVPASFSDKIILVLEDDDDVRQHSVETLRELGYRVIEAHDGPAALSLLSKRRDDIALMFCDLHLSHGASGQDVAAEARRLNPSMKILYTSGSADGDVLKTRSGTSEALIPKPFSGASLARRLQEVLEG